MISRRRWRKGPPAEIYDASPQPDRFAAARPAGPLRQAAATVFFVAILGFAIWDLGHAAATGVIYGKHGWVRLDHDPLAFWFNVAMFGVVAIFGAGLAALLLPALVGRRASERRIDAHLQRRADEGGQASAIPPRLR